MTATLIKLAAGFGLGCVIGLVYLRALRRNVDLYAARRFAVAIAIHAVRLTATAAIFFFAGLIGLSVLAGSMLGFLTVRTARLRAETA